MGSHAKRWLTALVAVPLVFTLILYGSELAFAVLIAAVSAACFYEYASMAFGEDFLWGKKAGIIASFLLPLAAYGGGVHSLLACMSASFFIICLLFLFRLKISFKHIDVPVKYILGLLYVPFMLSHTVLLRESLNGVTWIFFVVFLAFASDIFAFYIGTLFGKTKLIPSVSPGKTNEGAIGSFFGAIGVCVLFKLIFFQVLPLGHAVVLGMFGNIIGQMGDLFESALKRIYLVKDSGGLLPGHGGVLDRVDSLIFLIPFVYYYRVYFIQ